MTYQRLPDATDDQIRSALRGTDTVVSQSDLLAELDRRLTREQNARLTTLTRDVRDMTKSINRLTVAAIIVAVAAACIALASLAIALR